MKKPNSILVPGRLPGFAQEVSHFGIPFPTTLTVHHQGRIILKQASSMDEPEAATPSGQFRTGWKVAMRLLFEFDKLKRIGLHD